MSKNLKKPRTISPPDNTGKSYKVNGTPKQLEATRKVLESIGSKKPYGTAMLEAGYTEASAKNPKILTESKAFKMICEESGLTPELITNALVEDIKSKKGKRKPELELASKILGIHTEKTEVTEVKSLSDLMRKDQSDLKEDLDT